jgi:hypothetical protein
MKLITTKLFKGLEIEVYSKEGSTDFYMCRSQINSALKYKDEKTLARIISTHRDVIGEGVMESVSRTEGDRFVTRELEMFSFEQIFQMLRFSKSEVANAFMDFTAVTMKFILTEQAELVFSNPQAEKEYVSIVKSLLAEYKALGITKSQAALIIHEAKLNEQDPNVIVLSELRRRRELELEKLRGRIRERVIYYARTYLEEDYEEAWHILAYNLKFELGTNFKAARDRMKAAREKARERGIKPLPEVKGYLELIEEHKAFAEAEKVIKKMCVEKAREISKKVAETVVVPTQEAVAATTESQEASVEVSNQ